MATDTILKAHRDYYFDSSGYYSYILLNGTPELLKSVIAQLPKHHLRCLHDGRSRRSADNRQQYDWFIRVEKSDGQWPTFGEVISFFDKFNDYLYRSEISPSQEEAPPSQQIPPQVSFGQRQYQELLARYDELREESKRHFAILKQDKEQAIKVALSFKEQLTEERKISEQRKKQISELEKKLGESDKLVEGFIEDFDEREKQLKESNRQLENLQQVKDHFERELHDLRSRQVMGEAVSPRSETERILEICWPEVVFIGDSIDMLTQEFQTTVPVIRKLREIVVKNGHNRSVAGVDDWKECQKFGTGQKASGRLYYLTPDKSDDGKYHIWITDKRRQRIDFENLRKNRV